MGDVITFPRWMRFEPIYPTPYEINCIVVYNFLDWEIPRSAHFSVFQHKFLDRISGYRNRESYNYLKQTNNFYDARVTEEIYGVAEMPENVRWPHHG
jgi:hypothetical protein